MRWSPYFRVHGDEQFGDLWAEQGTKPTLVVAGDGFDPRAPRALEVILDRASDQVSVVRIGLSSAATDETARELTDTNRQYVNELVQSRATLSEQAFPAVHTLRSAGAAVSRTFHEAKHTDQYEQIVIDISALPRSVFFPLIAGLLKVVDRGWSGDLHVVVCENPQVDRAILEEGAEAAGALGGFSGPPDDENWAATVWVPVLGEGKEAQLAALVEAIDPNEVTPVLPFPAENPRRGDDLLLEYRELLVDRIAVEPRNYIYAAEANPFDLYRAVSELHDRYQAALRPLGAAKFVLSTHSSKLLSVGALLAAYERGLQVMHVSPTRYGLRSGVDLDALRKRNRLADLWLAGAPYR